MRIAKSKFSIASLNKNFNSKISLLNFFFISLESCEKNLNNETKQNVSKNIFELNFNCLSKNSIKYKDSESLSFNNNNNKTNEINTNKQYTDKNFSTRSIIPIQLNCELENPKQTT